jgi:hypothetical protein
VRTKSRGLIAVTSMIVSMSAMWTMADVPKVSATCAGTTNQSVSREDAREQGAAGTCNGNGAYTGTVRTIAGVGKACVAYGFFESGSSGGCNGTTAHTSVGTFNDADQSAIGNLYFVRANGVWSPGTTFLMTGF